MEGDNPEGGPTENDQNVESRPKRSKRLMKSTGDNEPAAATDHVKLADEEESHTAHDHDDTEGQN